MTEMVLPQFGMGMADGTIIVWHKAEGDRIEAGEPLCDVEAAKTTVEVPAPLSGILQHILVPAGVNVPVNTVIALIGDTALADQPRYGDKPEVAPVPVPQPAPEPAPEMVLTKASLARPAPQMATQPPARPPRHRAERTTQIEPRARRAARLRGVDLSCVVGTGPGGRIIESDILTAAATPDIVPAAAVPVEAVALPAAKVSPPPAPVRRNMRQLRMRCAARPLVDLLAQLAHHHGAAVPIEAALLKATALAAARGALVEGALAQGGIGLRCDAGVLRMIDNPAQLSICAIARHLDAADIHRGPSPGLMIEWHNEAWLDEVASLDPGGPACLSFGAVAFQDGPEGEHLTAVLTISEAGNEVGNEASNRTGLSLVEAKLILQSIHELLTRPMALLA